jgi:hypothetical protein
MTRFPEKQQQRKAALSYWKRAPNRATATSEHPQEQQIACSFDLSALLANAAIGGSAKCSGLNNRTQFVTTQTR